MTESQNEPTEVDKGAQTGEQATPAATGDDSGKDVESIPMPRFNAVNEAKKQAEAKLSEAAERLRAYEEAEQKQKDEAARARGDVEATQKERDELKQKLEAANGYVSSRTERLIEQLDERGRGLVEALPESVSGVERLSFIEGLVEFAEQGSGGQDEPKAPAFGSTGGRSDSDGSAGMIPSHIKSLQEYREWFGPWSQTPEGRQVAANRDKMAELRAEKARRFQQ